MKHAAEVGVETVDIGVGPAPTIGHDIEIGGMTEGGGHPIVCVSDRSQDIDAGDLGAVGDARAADAVVFLGGDDAGDGGAVRLLPGGALRIVEVAVQPELLAGVIGLGELRMRLLDAVVVDTDGYAGASELTVQEIEANSLLVPLPRGIRIIRGHCTLPETAQKEPILPCMLLTGN